MIVWDGQRPSNLHVAMWNSAFSFFALACRLVGSSLIVVIIARLPSIGVAEFGDLTYAMALGGLFIVASQFGFAPLLIRDIAADSTRLPVYARSVMSLRMGFSIAGLAALLGYIHLIDMTSHARWVCVIIAIAFYLGSFSIDLQALFQSQERMHLEFIGVAMENISLVGLTLLAFLRRPTLVDVACMFLVSKSAALAVNYLLCGRFVLWVYPVVNWDLWKRLLWEAAPFALAAVITLGIVQIDTVLLRELNPVDSERSVGLYQAAVRLFLIPTLLPQIVLKVLLPQLSRMHGPSGQDLVRDLGRVNHILLTLGLLIGLVTLFRGRDLVRLVYGEKLAEAGPLLQIFGVTIMMRFGAAYNIYFTIRNRIWFRVISALAALLAVVVFNWILIPRYGALGAAYGSVLAHVVYWLPFLTATYVCERTVSLGWQVFPALAAAGVLLIGLYATASYSLLYMLPVYALAVLLLTFVTIPQGERNRLMTHILLRGA